MARRVIRRVTAGAIIVLAALILANVFRYKETIASPDQPLIVRTDRWTGQQTIREAARGELVESVAGFFEQQRMERARQESARRHAEWVRLEAERRQAAFERDGRRLREALAAMTEPDR